MRALWFVGVAVALAGCEGAALPSPSEVRDLRVLALTTATPEVRPGQGARVEAALLDPSPSGVASVRWRLCEESSIADPRACPLSPRGRDVGEGLAVDLPALSATRGGVGSYVVLAAACARSTPAIDIATGHYRCAEGGAALEAFRRVGVRETGPLNRAPAIARVELSRGGEVEPVDEAGGVALTRCDAGACEPWEVRVVPAPGASEATPEGPRESLVASFYVTAGAMSRPRDASGAGEERPLVARWSLAPGSVAPSFGVVLRDQRGGESVRVGRVVWR